MFSIVVIKKSSLNKRASVQYRGTGPTVIARRNDAEFWRDRQPDKWDWVICQVPRMVIPGNMIFPGEYMPIGVNDL